MGTPCDWRRGLKGSKGLFSFSLTSLCVCSERHSHVGDVISHFWDWLNCDCERLNGGGRKMSSLSVWMWEFFYFFYCFSGETSRFLSLTSGSSNNRTLGRRCRASPVCRNMDNICPGKSVNLWSLLDSSFLISGWSRRPSPSCVQSWRSCAPSLLWTGSSGWSPTCPQTRRQTSRRRAWWACSRSTQRWRRRGAGQGSPGKRKRHLGIRG